MSVVTGIEGIKDNEGTTDGRLDGILEGTSDGMLDGESSIGEGVGGDDWLQLQIDSSQGTYTGRFPANRGSHMMKQSCMLQAGLSLTGGPDDGDTDGATDGNKETTPAGAGV